MGRDAPSGLSTVHWLVYLISGGKQQGPNELWEIVKSKQKQCSKNGKKYKDSGVGSGTVCQFDFVSVED